jgi:hypothetical protein
MTEGEYHCDPVPMVVHEGRIWQGIHGWIEGDIIVAPGGDLVNLTILHHIPLASTKPREVLPCGFLQVPAADRLCDSRLHRPTPPARRFVVCLIGFRDNYWYLMTDIKIYHCLILKIFVPSYPVLKRTGFTGRMIIRLQTDRGSRVLDLAARINIDMDGKTIRFDPEHAGPGE